MGFFPSLFEVFTGRGEMWASAAEGFFMISGLLVGYVYGPRMIKNAVAASRKIWKRAFLLYTLTVLLTFLFVWWGNMSDINHVKSGLWMQPALGELLFKSLTLQYYYGWSDFLPYYAIFMALAPLALYLTVRGKAWLVLAVSAICWLLRGSSFELSWQVLFMGSMVVGWYLPKIESWACNLSPVTKRGLFFGLYSLSLVLLTASVLTIRVGEWAVHEYADFTSLPHAWQSVFVWLDDVRDSMTPLIVKWTLEPVRVITAVTWFMTLYVLVRSHEAWIVQHTRGFFKTLGEHSLVVYVVHAITVFGLQLVIYGDHGMLLNSLMSAAVIVFVYAVVRAYMFVAIRTRRKVVTGLQRLQLTNEETS